MKKNNFLILWTLTLLLSSCGARYTNNSVILQAEALMNNYPDSAYKLLTSIPNPEKLSRADYAAWCLQYTHAQYKSYKDITSDSIISIAVNYYDNSKLYKYSGTAYYLSGAIAYLAQEYKKGVSDMKKAIDLLEHTDEYDLIGLASINLSYQYQREGYIQNARKYIFQSLKNFTASGNKKYLVYSYQKIGDFYSIAGYPPDSSCLYFQKAVDLAKEVGDSSSYYINIGNIGFEIYAKDPRDATNKILTAYKHSSTFKSSYTAFLAYTYTVLNKPDSAEYFLKEAEKLQTNTSEQHLLKISKARIHSQKKQYDLAYNEITDAYLLNEKILTDRIKSQIYSIDKQYDFTEKEKENATLKIANKNKLLLIGGLTMMVISALIFLLYIRGIHRKKQAELELRNKKTEYELKIKAQEAKNKYDLLKQKLQQRIEISLQFRKIQNNPTLNQKKEEILDDIIRKVILQKDEWDYYENEVNSLLNNKLNELREHYKNLTKADMIVIALIYMDVSTTDTCTLMNMNKETLYTRRKRIKKHLNISEDTEIEAWLHAYANAPSSMS
ncbi:MAG: TPR-repeat-containing protein [Bacteroidetes bacterium]|nr:TPR-repeat-containing protein [Bacteroidota bacterium]